jgi:tetratricopeptide (TPR) repeat protein
MKYSRKPGRFYRKEVRRRSLTGQYAFVSYSSRNWDFVQKLIEPLKSDGVWVDKWNIDVGDPLPTRIESGVAGSSEFIAVLSKESLASNWARYESHMAVIRSLEDANFRIIVVRIDDSEVPLRFKPFLYIDGAKNRDAAIEQLREAIRKRREGQAGEVFRRQFVNRSDEIGQIELAVGDPDRSLICLFGLYGMGKRTVAEEAIKRIWQKPNLTIVELSEAHFGARLALQLCALARIDLPKDGAPADELQKASLLAVETLISKNQTLVFDRLETLLDDFGVLHSDIRAVIEHVSRIRACYKMPVFLLSKRMPRLSAEMARRTGLIKVGSLLPQHTTTILENEVNRIERKEYGDRSALVEIAKHLHGYPLAARLAAPLLVKHSPDYLLQNLVHVADLRRDVADAILSHTHPTPAQVAILKVLSICDGSLTVGDLSAITARSPEEVVAAIDRLADDNLIEADGVALRLHPLVLDFYWKQARSSPDFVDIVSAIATHAQSLVRTIRAGSAGFIQWLAIAVRTLFLSGKAEAARALRQDLIGELKVACIELYQRQEYVLCLRYCNEYLQADSLDFEVALHKARCLSRLGQSSDALQLLETLLTQTHSRRRQVRILFAIARTHFEARRDEEAKRSYLKTLDVDPNFLPALEGITELLLKGNKVPEADGFVQRAIKVAPMNSWALGAHADILWRKGRVAEAIAEMEKVVKSQPDNPTFLFRLGRFYQQSGAPSRAYELFQKAATNDNTYLDVRLSLASWYSKRKPQHRIGAFHISVDSHFSPGAQFARIASP